MLNSTNCLFQAAKLEAAEQKLNDEKQGFDSKMDSERENWKQQIKSYTDSIQILVMEKTDLEGLLTKTQTALTQKDGENLLDSELWMHGLLKES